ncbi:MAG: acyl-CoA dehydrogenase family protein [Porticoccaceae bacterium]|nr:acyl-CoA dehydrogenase family protein [Porticoccaceae bacterium]
MQADTTRNLNDEQQMLADSVSKYLTDTYSFDARRSTANGDLLAPHPQWQQFANMGWLGLPFDDCDGGFSGGPTEISLLFQAFGKHLVLEPYLETVVLAGGVIARGQAVLKQRYLDGIMSGDIQGAFGHGEAGHSAERYYVSTSALKTDHGWQLNGTKAVVANGPLADVLVISARIEGDVRSSQGIGLFVIDRHAAGIAATDYVTVDGRRASEISLNHVEIAADALVSTATDELNRVLDRGCFAVCAEAIGAMQALLSATVEYCQQRRQFGQPIGSFQALQHRMVDMYIALELARSLLGATTDALTNNDENSGLLLSALKYRVDKSARLISYGALQLHGGIAMTDELNIGHYFKRLTLVEKQFGTAQYHLQRFKELQLQLQKN